jgi:hypothetical protein
VDLPGAAASGVGEHDAGAVVEGDGGLVGGCRAQQAHGRLAGEQALAGQGREGEVVAVHQQRASAGLGAHDRAGIGHGEALERGEPGVAGRGALPGDRVLPGPAVGGTLPEPRVPAERAFECRRLRAADRLPARVVAGQHLAGAQVAGHGADRAGIGRPGGQRRVQGGHEVALGRRAVGHGDPHRRWAAEQRLVEVVGAVQAPTVVGEDLAGHQQDAGRGRAGVKVAGGLEPVVGDAEAADVQPTRPERQHGQCQEEHTGGGDHGPDLPAHAWPGGQLAGAKGDQQGDRQRHQATRLVGGAEGDRPWHPGERGLQQAAERRGHDAPEQPDHHRCADGEQVRGQGPAAVAGVQRRPGGHRGQGERRHHHQRVGEVGDQAGQEGLVPGPAVEGPQAEQAHGLGP